MKATKIALTIFLLYHLSAVALLPIGSSLLGRKLAWLFLPYANTLGFNTTWQFFSPGPSPMFYLEYRPDNGEDVIANVAGSDASEPLTYPEKRHGTQWSEAWNRRLFGMRFLALNAERTERYLVPFLCRAADYPKSVDLKSVVERVEDIERPGEASEFKDLTERVELPRQKYSCPERPAI